MSILVSVQQKNQKTKKKKEKESTGAPLLQIILFLPFLTWYAPAKSTSTRPFLHF
ncbi:hypothetical protein BO70DRAFT_357234, partial [Aspergillus heteromorphus CBS 117.55]